MKYSVEIMLDVEADTCDDAMDAAALLLRRHLPEDIKFDVDVAICQE